MVAMEGVVGVGTVVGRELLKPTPAADAVLAEIARDAPEMLAASRLNAEIILARKQIVHRIVTPIGRWFAKQPYSEDDFETDLAERMVWIPESDIVDPNPIVAGPALDGLSYSLDEPNLKELYLQLLATACDGRDTEAAHPGFAQVIRQLAPSEVRSLQVILGSSSLPIVTVHRQIGPLSRRIVFENVLRYVEDDTGAQTTQLTDPARIDNWIRLGLVSVTYSASLADGSQYKWASVSREAIDARDRFQGAGEEGEGGITLERGILAPTAFGKAFANAVGMTRIG